MIQLLCRCLFYKRDKSLWHNYFFVTTSYTLLHFIHVVSVQPAIDTLKTSAISWNCATVESFTSSCIVLSNLFIWLPYYNQAEAKRTLWLRFQTRETNKKYKWVPRPVVLVRLNPTNLVTMTMTIMVQLPLGRRWTSKPRIRKCSIVVALTSFRVTLGTRHR